MFCDDTPTITEVIVANTLNFKPNFTRLKFFGGPSSQLGCALDSLMLYMLCYVMTPASQHVVWRMFCEDTPTSPEVIVANTVNLKPDF